MSALAFWLLMVVLAAFIGAIFLVVFAVRTLLRRSHRVTIELAGLSNDISDIVGSESAAEPAASD